MATDLGITVPVDSPSADHKLEHDSKRDADKRHKYSLGVVDRADYRGDSAGGRPVKPALPMSKRRARAARRHETKERAKLTATFKGLGKHRVALNTDDLGGAADARGTDAYSTDESVREPSPAPDPEAEITYSFDAARGASQGDEVLGQAVVQAVEKFETRETQKLVDKEYDVVSVTGDADEDSDTDGDFELV